MQCTSPLSMVLQCKLVSGCRLRKLRSVPPNGPYGSGRTLRFYVFLQQNLLVSGQTKWHQHRFLSMYSCMVHCSAAQQSKDKCICWYKFLTSRQSWGELCLFDSCSNWSRCCQHDPKRTACRLATTSRKWTWSTLTRPAIRRAGHVVVKLIMRMMMTTMQAPGCSGSSVPTNNVIKHLLSMFTILHSDIQSRWWNYTLMPWLTTINSTGIHYVYFSRFCSSCQVCTLYIKVLFISSTPVAWLR